MNTDPIAERAQAIAELRAMLAAVTPGDIKAAQRYVEAEEVECPFCQGAGDVEAADYCNFDGRALGVQFYGIGPEFGAHERLWTATIKALPWLLDSASAALTTDSRPEGLERMTALDEDLDEAHPGWMTGTEPQPQTDALHVPCEQTMQDAFSTAYAKKQERTSQPNAPASEEVERIAALLLGSVNAPEQEIYRVSREITPIRQQPDELADTQLLQAIRDIGQGGQPVEVVLHSDGGWEVRTRDATIAMREATPPEGAWDSALEERLMALRSVMFDCGWHNHAETCWTAVRALRTAKPEQAGAGFVMVPVDPTEDEVIDIVNVVTGLQDANALELAPVEGARHVQAIINRIAAAPQGQNSGED